MHQWFMAPHGEANQPLRTLALIDSERRLSARSINLSSILSACRVHVPASSKEPHLNAEAYSTLGWLRER